ncbi:MAG: hypothetical protein OEZ30_07260, partial [Candidatus Aminicenantes bacterium]|nr:hypothetical protein [Candidatus Aminicenantes bacterium]
SLNSLQNQLGQRARVGETLGQRGVIILILVVFLSAFLCLSVQAQTSSEENPLSTAEGVVAELYQLVTFEAGSTPDWEKVRSLFIDEAVIVLRTSWENITIFSVQGFIDDFVNFIERFKVEKTGFVEEIKRTKAMVFGDMAHILVLYEASIPGSERPPQQGVDSFLLINKDGRWWIAAVTNELPTPDNPLPAELRK